MIMRKYLQKITITLIPAILMTICAITTAAAASIEFPDMQGHWAKPYVDSLVATGAITGFEDGLFHPGEFVTTQQFITILMRSQLGELETPEDDWSLPYIAAALQNGVIEGDDVRSSDQPMDRLSAVRYTHLFLSNIIDEQDAEHVSAAQQLTDISACRDCRVHLEQCYVKGIVTGRPGPTFDGDANLTRAEASIMIVKALDPSMRTPPIVYQDEEETLITADTVISILENNSKAILVDVRMQEEYDAAHIPGSIVIPLDKLMDPEVEKPFDHETHIIVYCKAGSRSKQAYDYLIGQGFEHVYSLGKIDNWPYEIEGDQIEEGDDNI
jgi:rhodanese-related sulfurtransferase